MLHLALCASSQVTGEAKARIHYRRYHIRFNCEEEKASEALFEEQKASFKQS